MKAFVASLFSKCSGLVALIIGVAVAIESPKRPADPRYDSKLRDAVVMTSVGAIPDGLFNRCALVGSSPNLLGQRRGQEIDSHDTVIRINRLPTEQFHEDFGSARTVYFIRHGHATNDWYNGIMMGNGAQHKCSYIAHRRDSCNVGFIIMGGYATPQDYLAYLDDPNSFQWESQFLPVMKGKEMVFPKAKGVIPVASQLKDIALATHLFRDLQQTEPSTGFHAILTFGAMCNSLDLYGFGGEGTADGHFMWAGHPIAKEHGLLAKILDRRLDLDTELHGGKARKTAAYKWLKEHLEDIMRRGHIRWMKGSPSTSGSGVSSAPASGAREATGDAQCSTGGRDGSCAAPGAGGQGPGASDGEPHALVWQDVVDSMSTAAYANHLGRCALVGTSSALQGRRWGAEIDAHDTVIRVNRLPSHDLREDFGARTDIYFVRHGHRRPDGYVSLLAGLGHQNTCGFKRSTVEHCNVSSVVFGGGVSKSSFDRYVDDPASRWQDEAFLDAREPLSQFGHGGDLPVFASKVEILLGASMFKMGPGMDMSANFHAFLTFAPVCESVKLYAFTGEQALDGHELSSRFDFESEYRLIQRLLQGQIKDRDFQTGRARSTPAFLWLDGHLPSYRKTEFQSTTSTTTLPPKPDRAPEEVVPPRRQRGPGSRPEKLKLASVLSMLSTASPLTRQRLGRCALVGTGKELDGSGRGREIDRHDTVIRVNRVPSPDHQGDLGSRTDVYFIRHSHLRREGFLAIVSGMGEQRSCSFRPGSSGVCNVSNLVLGGGLRSFDYDAYIENPGGFQWEEHYSQALGKSRPNLPAKGGSLPVGSQKAEIAMAAFALGGNSQARSSNFNAFLTFAPVCASISLFGYTGEQAQDGHDTWRGYDRDWEGRMMRRLLRGEVLESDLELEARGTPAHSWLVRNLASFTEAAVESSDEEVEATPVTTPPPARQDAASKPQREEEERPEVSWAHALQMLTVLQQPLRRPRFGRCALVGPDVWETALAAGYFAGGNALAQEIDSHDTVIRVDRLPTTEQAHKVGRRTDVYFVRYQHAATPESYTAIFAGDGRQARCFYDPPSSGDECSGLAMLAMGGGVGTGAANAYWRDPSTFRWEQGFPPSMQGRQLKLPKPGRGILVASQTKEAAFAAHLFKSLRSKEPSLGLHAFLTFATVCDTVRLYDLLPDKAERRIAKALAQEPAPDEELVTGEARGSQAYQWLAEQMPRIATSGRVSIGLQRPRERSQRTSGEDASSTADQ